VTREQLVDDAVLQLFPTAADRVYAALDVVHVSFLRALPAVPLRVHRSRCETVFQTDGASRGRHLGPQYTWMAFPDPHVGSSAMRYPVNRVPYADRRAGAVHIA